MNDELETNSLNDLEVDNVIDDEDDDDAIKKPADENGEANPLHSHESEEDLIEEDVDEVDFDVDEDDHY